MDRAYALLELKAIDDDARILEGMASTPVTDRQGDIVEPKGAKFSLPIPLLWQHRSDSPIGHVISAKVTGSGISIRAQLAKTDEPGALKEILDRAWQSIKLKLVRGLSIGFRPLQHVDIDGTWGRRFTEWEWLELSAVTIPANADASISSIKSIDAEHRPIGAGSRRLVMPAPLFRGCENPPPGSRSLSSPGASGTSKIYDPNPEGGR